MSAPAPSRPSDAASRIVLAYLAFGVGYVALTETLEATLAEGSWRLVVRLLFVAVSGVMLSVAIGRELRLRQRAEREATERLEAQQRAQQGELQARRQLELQARTAEILTGDVDESAMAELGAAIVPDVADLALLVVVGAGPPRLIVDACSDAVDRDSLDLLIADPTFLVELRMGAGSGAVLAPDGDHAGLPALQTPLAALGLQSFVVASAPVDDGYAVLLAATATDRRGLRPSDLDALAVVVDQVAVALEGVALHDATRAATERLAALVNGSPVGILELDAAGRICTVNLAAQESLGLHPDATLHPELSSVLEEVRVRLEQGQVVLASEVSTTRVDGTPIDVWLSASLVTGGPAAPAHLLVVLADVTERRQLRQQIEQAQRLESLGQMAGAIAHDYNNLLTAILGYTSIIERKLGPDHPCLPDLQKVRNAGERSRLLADQLLTISRHRVVETERLDAAEVVRGVLPIVARLVGGDIEVVAATHGPTGAVMVDRRELEGSLLNLAINAREAMPDGGTLTITTRAATLRDAPAVAIEVADDGHGMDAAVLARCFEPFFTTKDDRSRGAGLGLATVHAAASQAGGTVLADSAPGAGARFTIVLPAAPPSPADTALALGTGGGERILLVDDEADVRSYARDVLVASGYDVVEAADGVEAAALVDGGLEFDLLLTDVVMPHLGGADLARHVVQARPEVPVLFASGYAEELTQPEPGRRVPFLPKPFEPDALLQAVRGALDEQSAPQGSNR